MNKMHQKENEVNETLLGIIMILAILFFIIFKFFKQDEVVENIKLKEELQKNASITEEYEYKSQAYKNYLLELETLRKEENYNQDKENALAKEMVSKLIKATAYEKSNLEIKNSDFSYNKDKYQEYIDKILAEAKKRGMGEEMRIFISQARANSLLSGEEGQSLELSDTDKETLIYIAKAYEYFANEVIKLPTPTEYLKVANLLVNNSMDTATILKKMAIEEDPLISAVWFARYSEAVKIFYQSKKNTL